MLRYFDISSDSQQTNIRFASLANENSVETSFELKPSSLLPENRHPYYAYNGTIMGDCGTEARYFVLEDRLKLPQERVSCEKRIRLRYQLQPRLNPYTVYICYGA